MIVDLFVPCFIDQIYPDTALNAVKVLEKAGCEVHYNKQQTCCGQPAFNSGFWNDARSIGKKFLKDYGKSDHYIVALSGSCTGYIRNYYAKLFENSTEYNHYKDVKKRLYEFTEFLSNVLHISDFGAHFKGVATYHDGCGSLRECHIKEAPRKLLENVSGLELIEMQECETCCGFGGTFAVKFEPISTGMAQTKVQSALDAGARYIVSSDMSCLLHLDAYIRKQGIDLKTVYIADVLANGIS